MTILVVDDQKTVIDGLLLGIDFQKLGFDTVKTAYSADEALGILQSTPVDVLMTDIEMPGRNGLELNSIVKERYPDILRILLTSHAVFSYAQEGIRLGCFDYLVQPVPYHAIAASLSNAVEQLSKNEQLDALSSYGALFQSNRSDFLNTITYRLYSPDFRELNDAVSVLNQAGYQLNLQTRCQLLILDVFSFSSYSANAPSHRSLRSAVVEAVDKSRVGNILNFLITITRKEILIMLFSETGENIPCPVSALESFYGLARNILPETGLACYVGTDIVLQDLRQSLSSVRSRMRENVSKESGLFYVDGGLARDSMESPTSLPEYLSRWNDLLQSHQKSILRDDIFTYLDKKFSGLPNKYQKLCELHQQLTQIFFRYFYDNDIDINSVFNDSFRYADYMESYSTVDALKQAVTFILEAEGAAREGIPLISYVERAKTFIANNTNKQLTVKNVADYINLTPEYLTRLFKKETGMNVKDYIVQCKISAAKDLLANVSLPISLVALELGYSNFSHFTQMFKKAEGITPSEYRQLHKKQN